MLVWAATKNQYVELLLGNACEMFKHFAVNLKKVMRTLSASALVLFISDMKHLTSFSHSILIPDDLIWSQKNKSKIKLHTAGDTEKISPLS